MGGGGGHTVNPPNYLWQSIVCTLLCCLPFGIVGIVYAAKVDGLSVTGKAAEALEASNKAKFWCWMSFGTSIVGIVLYAILMVAVA
ncbi:CD225/dispanin family protein [Akkermansiaceae bacterium]|nr:CD225/dispanin family protein [Akkermansiaceae bacterium]MDB4700380.1 CD225/dispanin family protein [Akkermansiaceae bacterium]MDC0321265.1 CD225/dispanin family protein [Akkermansiaceae bacterium]